MAEQDNDQSPTQTPETQNVVTHRENSATLPATEQEASNIAHEFRSLASRVESFPVHPTETISQEADNVARMSRSLASRVEGGFKVRFGR